MPIYIFGSFSTNGSETNYTMTNLTNSTITATSEDGNSTITLNYTISWYDGMYTLIITGADDASQAAIGDEPLTFTSNTQYFAKQ